MSSRPPDDAPRNALDAPGPWLPLAVWVAAALLGYLTLGRGWLPHDAGVLGHASERVLAGELPHRDFYDTYTGGLALLNAAAFKVLGVSVMSMRWVFFAAYLLWVPVFWAVARRVSGPWAAAVATLLAAAASLPAYPEGMPSWYNLFLATAGVWALLRHEAGGGPGWLLAAGVAGGVSILFKVIGLYFLAGAGLYLLAQERRVSMASSPEAAVPAGDDRTYRTVVLVGLALVAAATARVVLRAGDPTMFIYFGVPPLAAIAAVAARVAVPTGAPAGVRFARITRWSLLVGVGAAVPVVLFAIPWVASGALGALWEGVFVLPQNRFASAAWTPPPVAALVSSLAVVAWIAVSGRLGGAIRLPVAGLGVGLLGLGLAMSHTEGVYRAFWYLMAGSGVVVAGLYAWRMARTGHDDPRGVLLLAVFSYHALVQIPFAAPVYALYAFPMMVLVVLAAAESAPFSQRRTLHTVMAALLLFVLVRVDTGFLYHLGFRYRPHNQTEALALSRAAGVRVSAGEKEEYEALVATVESLDPGAHIFAFPDSPEVYFLTGRLNPTPSMFDFLDPDLAGRDQRALERLDELGVRVVVLNRRPLFSGPADPAFLRALEARYPNAREVGRFLVVSRSAGAAPWAPPPAP